MAGQHRWSPGAALTVAQLTALVERKQPADYPDIVAWVDPGPDGRVYRRAARARQVRQPQRGYLRTDRPPVPPSTVPYHVGGPSDRDGRQPRPGAAVNPVPPRPAVLHNCQGRHRDARDKIGIRSGE